MLEIVGLARNVPPQTWGFGVIGLVVLVIGLVLVIWPRKANEIMWTINQAMRPWPMRKPPVGSAIAIGCLALVLATIMLTGTFIDLWG